MAARWKINNNDTQLTYGMAVKAGSYLDIMSPPVPRKRLEHEFTDANGAQVDTTSALTYEARRYTLRVIIAASSFADFWARYNALLTAIAKPGTFSLYVADLGITVNLLYEGMKCAGKPGSLRSGKVVAEYELSVFEPDPTNRTYGA